MKKVWIILGCLVALAAIFVGILYGTAKSRVIGTWKTEIGYMDTYACEIVVEYEFLEDGTFSQAFRSVETGGIQNMKYGTWSMSGMEVHCQRDGNGTNTHFTFSPLTGTLATSMTVYEKID